MEFTEEKLIYDKASREASAHSRRGTGVETFFQSFPQLMEGAGVCTSLSLSLWSSVSYQDPQYT